MKHKNSILLTVLSFFGFYCSVLAKTTDATSLPLIQIGQLEYQGAFRIPDGTFGESNANYAVGTATYNPINNSLFFVGHNWDNAIAEISIPPIVNSTDISALNTASFLQNFSKVLNRTPDNNPQGLDKITGLKAFNGKLIINAMEYYDAPADNTHTSLVIDDMSDIANSTVEGFYSLQGRAHVAGWMSDIPTQWQNLLGGEFLAGNSSKYAINGRLPIGISAFVFNPALLSGTPSTTISTTTLLDYNLVNPMYADYSSYQSPAYNLIEVNGDTSFGHTFEDAQATVGSNSIWTEVSQVSFGFIVPGTATYLTLGSSGGHNSGIGYKPTQNNGNICGGPCAYDASDYYNYYWLWNVNDLVAVKNGSMQAYDVRPYAYGIFNAPFQTDIYQGGIAEHHAVIGGAYDSDAGLLYLLLYDAGSLGQYTRIPLVVAYKIDNTDLVYTNGFE